MSEENRPAVLIVDDQPNWRRTFSDLLADEYQITSVGSHEAALQTLDQDPLFQVAIVDIRLDDKDRANEDGLRLIPELRKKHIKVIIATGYPTFRTMGEALLQLGASAYVQKYPEGGRGFDPASFRRTVRDAVETFAFVLMPFASEYQDIYQNVVKRMVEDAGLTCMRADDLYDPSWIMDDVRRCIRQAKFLIGDLSDRNPNVLYEVGMTHAIGQTILLLTQDLDDVPPKLRDVRCIQYTNDLGGAERLERKLSETLNALAHGGFHSRPIFNNQTYQMDPKLCVALVPTTDSAQEAYEQIVRKMVEEENLDCVSTQGIFSAKHTMDAIWKRLNEARVIVADLSRRDAEVFYLTGISHGLQKPVILLAQSEDDVPFDLRGLSHIIYATKPLGEGMKARQQFAQVLKQVLREYPAQPSALSQATVRSATPRKTENRPISSKTQPTHEETYTSFALHIGIDGYARHNRKRASEMRPSL